MQYLILLSYYIRLPAMLASLAFCLALSEIAFSLNVSKSRLLTLPTPPLTKFLFDFTLASLDTRDRTEFSTESDPCGCDDPDVRPAEDVEDEMNAAILTSLTIFMGDGVAFVEKRDLKHI